MAKRTAADLLTETPQGLILMTSRYKHSMTRTTAMKRAAFVTGGASGIGLSMLPSAGVMTRGVPAGRRGAGDGGSFVGW
jgi:hypothetical protein